MPRKKPIKLLTLDTETYNGLLGGLKRVAIFDGEQVTYGYTFLEIEKEIKKYTKIYSVHIYIHNLEFDARKLPELFDGKRIEWSKSFVIDGKLATITTKNYTIHDSYKLLPMSLKKLSKDFEVEHGKLDLLEEVLKAYPNQYEIYKESGELDEEKTLVNFLDKCHVDDEVYLKYLGYDVQSLYEVLMKIIEISGIELDAFVKRVSTSSLSRYIFKNGYKGKQFKNPLYSTTDYEILTQYNWVNDLELEKFLLEGYCGGRTEVFKPYLTGGGYHYDVNSEYPFCMLGNFPVGKPDYYNTTYKATEVFMDWMENHSGLGFVHAKVYIPKQHIPPLPCKMGKLCFPTGEVFGTWAYEELEFAVKHCGVEIREIFAVCHFKQTYPVFKNFILTFYNLKEQATKDENESLRSFAKLVMNVGYGYTGMSRDKTAVKDIEEMKKYNPLIINEEYGYIEVESDIKSEYIQVAVAGTVTARARLVLLQGLKATDGNVYYCDTDSVVTDKPFPPELIDPYELGKWDLEGKGKKLLTGIFLRPKVYTELYEGDKINVKFKGVSKSTQETLTFESYQSLYKDLVEEKKESVLIEKNKTMLRSILYMEKKGLTFDYYETRDKKINLNTIEKRKMFYAENRTEPLHFETVKDFQNFSFKPRKQIVPFEINGGTK